MNKILQIKNHKVQYNSMNNTSTTNIMKIYVRKFLNTGKTRFKYPTTKVRSQETTYPNKKL
jgi:hypothetical protein